MSAPGSGSGDPLRTLGASRRLVGVAGILGMALSGATVLAAGLTPLMRVGHPVAPARERDPAALRRAGAEAIATDRLRLRNLLFVTGSS